MTQDNQNINTTNNTTNQPDLREILLSQLNGGLLNIFPAVKSNDLNLHKFNHLMFHLPNDWGEPMKGFTSLFVSPNPKLELSQINNKASKFASSIIDISLQSELVNHIDNNPQITLKEKTTPLFYTKEKANKTTSGSCKKWNNKISSSVDGPVSIFSDTYQVLKKLCIQNNASLNCISDQITLVVSASIMPCLIAKANGISAWDMLTTACPGIKLLVIPVLTSQQGECAVLVYNSNTFGPAGYTEIRGSVKFVPYDDTDHTFELIVPSRKLTITTPEQIAILTGI